MDEEQNPPHALDRRALLRKGAVAGAVAWTAPVVLSSPALAQVSSPAGCSPTASVRLNENATRILVDIDRIRACICGPITTSSVAGAGVVLRGVTGARINSTGDGTWSFTFTASSNDCSRDRRNRPACISVGYQVVRSGTTVTIQQTSGPTPCI